jgi:hypothetical protein
VKICILATPKRKEKEPVPLIKMLFWGKNWPKVATLWGVFL